MIDISYIRNMTVIVLTVDERLNTKICKSIILNHRHTVELMTWII